MQHLVAEWVALQEELQQEGLECVRASRKRKRAAASVRQMPEYEVGDYVLMARIRKLGSVPKLMTTWTGY